MNYVKLTVDAEAYYSGNTYYEEVILPMDVWEEIKDNFSFEIYLGELDGKHSNVRADIEVDEITEEELEMRKRPSEDGESLFYHIYEYLDEEKYDRCYLSNIQEQVDSMSKVESMRIRFKKDDKEKIIQLIGEYLL